MSFLFCNGPIFRPAVGPVQPPFPWVTGALSSVKNRPFTEVNNERRYYIYIYIYRERESGDIYIIYVYIYMYSPKLDLKAAERDCLQ